MLYITVSEIWLIAMLKNSLPDQGKQKLGAVLAFLSIFRLLIF